MHIVCNRNWVIITSFFFMNVLVTNSVVFRRRTIRKFLINFYVGIKRNNYFKHTPLIIGATERKLRSLYGKFPFIILFIKLQKNIHGQLMMKERWDGSTFENKKKNFISFIHHFFSLSLSIIYFSFRVHELINAVALLIQKWFSFLIKINLVNVSTPLSPCN